MPEFEEPEAASSSKQNYTPSTDATDKPRTRRRSGGFKTAPPATHSGLGEIDPAEALKTEKLSGTSKPAPKPKRERSAPKATKPKAEKPAHRTSNPQPSPATLAAIQRVEARLDERRQARGARRSDRDKTRSGKSDHKPAGQRGGSGKKPESGGLIASILNFFGLGSKPPVRKKSGPSKSPGSRGQGGRPRSKGGSGGGNRRPGSKRRSGGGAPRRSGGKGPRRSERSSQENQS